MLRTTALAIAVTSAATAASAFDGAYVGGQLGYAYSKFDLSNSSLSDVNENGVTGGINAGYLWALGNGWYMGPEFQYDWTDISITDADSGLTANFNGIARLKLIAGYEIGQGLLYGSAGFAYADFGRIGDIVDFDKNSYVLGIGYDWMVSDNWSIGGEYQYHNFSNKGSSGGDVNLNTLHIKAAYRF